MRERARVARSHSQPTLTQCRQTTDMSGPGSHHFEKSQIKTLESPVPTRCYRENQRSFFMRYTVVPEREADGGYVATVPALPGYVSQGDTRDEVTRKSAKRQICTLKTASPLATRSRLRREENTSISSPAVPGEAADGYIRPGTGKGAYSSRICGEPPHLPHYPPGYNSESRPTSLRERLSSKRSFTRRPACPYGWRSRKQRENRPAPVPGSRQGFPARSFQLQASSTHPGQ